MGRSQYDLFLDVLKKLNDSDVLPKTILIGSWCLPLYKSLYFGREEISTLRTRDIDFLISRETKFGCNVNLPALLEDLGFILEHSFPEGYIRLVHPELIIEFLVPDVGRGTSKPYILSELGLNAQRLRFLGLLERDTIVVRVSGLEVTIPHPVNFGLTKILVSSKRTNAEKQNKDLEAGLELLRMCIKRRDERRLIDLFRSISKNQQRMIARSFKQRKAEDLLEILK